MSQKTVLIVGAGIAGASTAWHLSQLGGHRIILLEMEDAPDRHSTGRNAAILRTAMPDPILHGLARESLDFYQTPPLGFSDQSLFEPVGLFLAATAESSEDFLGWTGNPDCQTGAQRVPPSQLYERIPQLAPGIEAAVYLPDEGVFDVAEIHHSFLKGAARNGVEIRYNSRVESLIVENEQLIGLNVGAKFLEADSILIAAGAWASQIANTINLPMPLTPYRRHIFVTNPLKDVQKDWPVVWIAGAEYYFRPESGGLLLSGCDQQAVLPEAGEVSNDEAVSLAAEKTERWLPSFADAEAPFYWAGMRTFAPDHRFVVGPDPRLGGLHWVAGLGGHGITCAPAVGNLAAEWIATGWSQHSQAATLAPGRFPAEPCAR
ncbi:MAG: FAD-dependent oxidoreductase [Planctomycetota bacterium]|jgi:D-arginine dehydrogenase|nr:FAD-dependent oxidoreductase [Planctomycetota bacterium]MDP6942017.1 FAD-dependent oxidoreductase [Planctomycetota bacterium]